MATTMTHIANEAGVSVSLVSRLLREDKTLKVTSDTRQRIMETCQKLGGVQSMPWTQKQNKRLHVVVPLNRIYASEQVRPLANNPMGRSFEHHLKKQGGKMSVVFFDEGQSFSLLQELIEDSSYCQGLLLGSGIIDSKVEQLLAKYHFPHIALDSNSNLYNVNSLFADQQGGVCKAVNYLIKSGHKQIAYLGPLKTRYPYFIAAMIKSGLEFEKQMISEIDLPKIKWGDHALWQKSASENFKIWIKTDVGQRCTAVYCHNDSIALGVIDAMRDLNMTPGKDLSVIGYDNAESRDPDIARIPILTTVDNPLEDVGQRAAERLIAQFEGKETKIMHERVPEKLIIRETTGPPKM